jgi:hypothetical protein
LKTNGAVINEGHKVYSSSKRNLYDLIGQNNCRAKMLLF